MRRTRRAVGLYAVALMAGMPGMLSASPAGASDHIVAVARFYAPTPLAAVPELIPEDYASADMSARLAAASAGLAVVPRARTAPRSSSRRPGSQSTWWRAILPSGPSGWLSG